MTTHGTGYAWKHPQAALAAASPTNWKFRHLLDGTGTAITPYQQIPDFDTDLGPVLDQDCMAWSNGKCTNPAGSPACTRFAATAIRNWQEFQDGAGGYPFTSAEALQSYNELKSGVTGLWPGDSIPYADGDIPLYAWQYEQKAGSADASGMRHVIAAYYQLDYSFGQTEQQWLDEFFSVLQAFGPVSVSSAWPDGWFASPVNGVMPTPGGATAGHMWAVKGKKTLADGTVTARCRQSWGSGWGVTDSFGRPGEFLIPVSYFALTAQLGLHECWKTIDATGEWPAPPPPAPPVPPEPVMSTVPLWGSPQLVDLAIGVQTFDRDDGKTPLTPITGPKPGPVTVVSPGAFDTAGKQLIVRISHGGINQEAIVNVADAKNPRPLYAAQVVK
jgi:hypothetical protein